MPPRGIVVFLAFSTLLALPARADRDQDPGDAAAEAQQASVDAVRASLTALKSAKSREPLAALSKSAKKLNLTDVPAAVALENLVKAVDAASSGDDKALSGLLPQVNAKGDAFLAALARTAKIPAAGVAVASVQPPKEIVSTLPGNVPSRALNVLNASLGTGYEQGSLVPAGSRTGPGFPVGAVANSPPVPPAVRDLGLSVPALAGATPPAAHLFHDAEFSMPAYRTAAVNALQHIENYIAAKPPGMPSLAPVAVASRDIAYEMQTLIRTTDRAVAAAAPPPPKVPPSKAVPVPPPGKYVPTPVATVPGPHLVVGTTGGTTSGKTSMATGRVEVGDASVNVTKGNIGRADVRYGLNAGGLYGLDAAALNVWVRYRPEGEGLRQTKGFGVSAMLDPVTNTQLSGSITLADTRKGPSTTFMLGLSGALTPLAP